MGGDMPTHADFIYLDQAATEHGVSVQTVKRRIRALGLPIYCDSRDLRRRLIRRSDLGTAFGPPVPILEPPPPMPPDPRAIDGDRRPLGQ